MRMIPTCGYTVSDLENCCTSNPPLAKLLVGILLPTKHFNSKLFPERFSPWPL